MVARRAPIVRTRRRSTTNWGRFVDTTTNVGSGTKVLLSVVSLSNPGIGEVVRRTRGMFSIFSDQTAAMETQAGAMGFVVVNDLAIATGASAIPGPATDANDDGWFVWVPFSQVGAISPGGTVTAGQPMNRYEFDSKAMRKVEEGYTVAIMIEAFGTSDGLEVSMGFSLLGSRMG